MASRSVNKVILIGNCTRDSETKFTPSGAAATKFSVATNRRWKDKQTEEWKEEVNYTNVILWNNDKLGPYLVKGKQVYVEGRLQSRSYDDKEGKKVYTTEVVADEVILLGGRGEGEGAGSSMGAASGGMSRSAARPSSGGVSSMPAGDDDIGPMGISDDDVPF